VDFLEAVVSVLQEEGRPLHWTVIQDLSLRRGYLDPFTQKDIRKGLLTALAEAVRDGRVRKDSKGVYSLPDDAGES
jgi:hypothetical protein